MGIDLRGDAAWQILLANCPALENMDVVRFTLDIDGAMDQIVATVDSALGTRRSPLPLRFEFALCLFGSRPANSAPGRSQNEKRSER
jgi:hypothetical protein